MGDVWVPIADILTSAGCRVSVDESNVGWESRSRSSGGFNGQPLGVQWHHTASSASVDSDLSYMIHGSPDEPVGNVLLARDGVFHPVAAGAANTSGKGGPNGFSRGVVQVDTGNTWLFSIEIANNGVGERYPQAQIDACFIGSNALNAAFGNQPDDVVTHALGAGDGYTSRKIDPATTNLAGPWVPRAVTSSGTWSQADLRAECNRRATSTPPNQGDDDMTDEQDWMLRQIHARLFGVTRPPNEGEDPAETRLLDRADGNYIIQQITAGNDRLFGVTRTPREGEDPSMTKLLDAADGNYIVGLIEALPDT